MYTFYTKHIIISFYAVLWSNSNLLHSILIEGKFPLLINYDDSMLIAPNIQASPWQGNSAHSRQLTNGPEAS